MRLLLDTHAFLWWDSKDSRLPESHFEEIASAQNQVYVSAVSVWEIAVKRGIGKVSFTRAIGKAIQNHGFNPLGITVEHGEWAGALPQLHRDPFDRLLVAQAQLEGLVLVTVDQEILRYHVPHL